jgi:two-component system phosphate regulon sensor histidine kinase PhoR
VQLQLVALPLRRIVAETFEHLKPRAQQQQVTLRNEVAEAVIVTADRRRLEQILINLTDNAIKFNKTPGDVIVRCERAADEAFDLLSVADTGTGIPSEDLPRVFERFYRVDKARSRAIGGTGLGLAIVKHLALAHGGEATVTSEFGKGTTFTIKLPVRDVVASG